MGDVVFVDTETTGLDPDQHEIWEVALVDADGRTFEWMLPVDLGRADPAALRIGRFHDRWQASMAESDATVFAKQFVDLTRGKHLVGAVISFDAERLWRLLRSNDQCPMWHYHLVDVEALIAGKLGQPPPWSSEDLSRAVGVDPSDFNRHTALGDALWVKAQYEAVMGAAK